jgi:hypothetical protein
MRAAVIALLLCAPSGCGSIQAPAQVEAVVEQGVDCLTQARSRADVDACLTGLAVEAQTQASAACVALGPLAARFAKALLGKLR